MELDKSINHICFRDGYEYFWILDRSGKRFVARAPVANPFDANTNQRVGARFEGTESWFNRFGDALIAPPSGSEPSTR